MADNEAGFELAGTFYPWQVSTKGGDLILIDQISKMPSQEFFQYIEADDVGRAPVLLGLVATSLRARHPEWSLDRIVRIVIALDLDDLTMVGGEEEAAEEVEGIPPAEAGDQPAPLSESPPHTSNGSAATTSTTSPEIPDGSGSPGSPTGSPITAETT